MSAHVRVTGIGFKVMRRQTVVGEPVKGFARVLREAVDGLLEAHEVAVGDDVVGKSLPAVLDGRIGLLQLGAAGREEDAAEIGGGVVGRQARVEHFDLLAGVDHLAGGHHARAAAAQNNHFVGMAAFDEAAMAGAATPAAAAVAAAPRK